MRPADPAAVRQRFARVVARGVARAAREQREELNRLTPTRKRTAEEHRRERAHEMWNQPLARRPR